MPAFFEQDLAFVWDGLDLAGTLHLPSPEGKYPVVLMMQGSGPADRDSDGYFQPIREAFLTRGLATFAFDKPGCGDSTGNWRDHGLEGRVDQALAALEMLRGHPAIDAERIGVWGQSQGGWLVQMLAGRVPDLSFAIANSGPSLNVLQQDLYGCEHTMRSQGHPESEIELALTFIGELHEAAQNGADYAKVDAQILQRARGEPWYGYKTIDDAEDWGFGLRLIEERYEPRDALALVRCPFLAVYGGLDVLVPAWRSAEETGRALQHAAAANTAVVVFPEGDHRIRDAVTEDFVAGYLDLLGDWAARRVGGPGHSDRGSV